MKKTILMIVVVVITFAKVTSQTVNDSVFVKSISDSSSWKIYEKNTDIPIPLVLQQKTKISIGFIFAPQGVISLQHPEKGFNGITPILAAVAFNKGNNTIKVTYNMTYNKIQGVYIHSFTPEVGAYFLINKLVFSPGGYTAVAITRSVFDEKASVFCEFGTSWNKWNPIMCMGVLIPFSFKVN